MPEHTFKYDVAFSFAKEDEALATQINDLIQDRLSTFLYSKRQEQIAGTDGEETFNRVFGAEARIVAVLYRDSWGKTPWTRIEETAIRNRAHEEGYDFAIFIPVAKGVTLPPWLPKNRIWVDLERWGVKGAAAVIEARVKESGGEPRGETVTDRAARIKRGLEIESRRKQFLASEEGVRRAHGEVENLFQAIEKTATDVIESGLLLTIARFPHSIEVSHGRLCLSIDWNCQYRNSLKDSSLLIGLWKGHPPRFGRYHFPGDEPSRLKEMRCYFDQDPTEAIGWRFHDEFLSRTHLKIVSAG